MHYIFVATSVVLVMTLLGSLAGVMHMDMHHSPGSSGDNCIVPGVTIPCPMSPTEHISAWSTAFVALPLQKGVVIVFVLVVASIFFVCVQAVRRLLLMNWLFLLYRQSLLFYWPVLFIQDLFAGGLLNPKPF